ncbi:hypothetical protein C1H46_001190 [Malus baccata]|uniref:Uncharacterized protein n=1 Tax=Malus baccata TaxID=106549 RepID=A0A540NPY8_MALBA|nr:hypothetical protein C1H46_001190 [Malus baccata]
MKSYGDILSHQGQVQKVLISLSKVYDPISVVIEKTSDLNTITVQEVVGSLKSYEQRLNRHVEDSLGAERAFASMSVNSGAQNKS